MAFEPSLQLASIVPVIEGNQEAKAKGVLILSCINSKKFILYWSKLENTPTQNVDAIFIDPEKDTQSDSEINFKPGIKFQVDCKNIETMSLSETTNDKNSLKISIQLRDKRKRDFSIDPIKQVNDIVEFFYKLLVKGISVPSHSNNDPYSFSFYEKANPNVFQSPPPNIRISTTEYTNLHSFWNDINDFYQDLITCLDESNTLPFDPTFPLGVAASAAHSRLLDQINSFIEGIGTFEPINRDNVDDLFDSNGAIKDPQGFKDRVFHGGIEDDSENDFTTRTRLLPFVFGVYPLTSTTNERKELDEQLLASYKRLNSQVDTISKRQLTRDKKLGGSFRVITQDVDRTDRTHNSFKAPEKPGMTMLTRLLRIYCLYNPPISYLQGMNDLFVPIIHSYFPIWDDEGNPVDPQGNVVEHEHLMPKIFWDYEAMLRNINHLSLLSGVKEQCMEKARVSLQIISKVCPMISIWFKKYGLSDLLWMYSDFVLLFKRTFSSIWDTWLQFNVSPDPSNWLIYFTAAIIIDTFPNLACLPEITITSIMDAFPKEINKVSVKHVGKIALWLHKVVPKLGDDDENDQIEPEAKVDFEKVHFDFFQTDWTQKQ